MDCSPPRPILLAAVGMFGIVLFLVIAIGALGVVFAVVSSGRTFGSAALPLSGCLAVAALFFWLAYLALRSVVRRIREAQGIALARRAIFEAASRVGSDRGSSAGK